MRKRLLELAAAMIVIGVPAGQAAAQNLTAEQQQALVSSPDPQLAANKRLVYDMYRIVLQAGRWQRIPEFIGPGYLQHNPNVASGPEALAAFIRHSRPERPIEEMLTVPLVSIVAERDLVVLNFARPEKDAAGKPYVTSWFDMFRVRDGKIVEHWDPALKSADALRLDPNSKRMPAE